MPPHYTPDVLSDLLPQEGWPSCPYILCCQVVVLGCLVSAKPVVLGERLVAEFRRELIPCVWGGMTDDSFRPDGGYAYSADLQLLSGMVASKSAPPELQTVVTPLNLDAWRDHLRSHPDGHFAQYLLSGIQKGFTIGFILLREGKAQYAVCHIKCKCGCQGFMISLPGRLEW